MYLKCMSSHCNHLQDFYRVELLHREIPVVITGNGFAVCTLAPTYILHDVLSLKLSDGLSQQAEALQVQLKSKLNLQKISYVLTADSRQIHSCVKCSGFRDCSQS